jgi:hypothetical protein
MVARHWRSLLGLVILGGLGFGVALGCLAGARRTETAYQRFEAAYDEGAVEVNFDEELPVDARLQLVDRVRRLPGLAQAGAAAWVFHVIPEERRDALITFVALDDVFGRELAVPRVVDGRRPDPNRADELAVSELAAENLGLAPGDTVELAGVPAEQLEVFFSDQEITGTSPRPFTVTGIVRTPDDLQPTGGSNFAYLTPAYWEETASDLAFLGPTMAIEVEDGQRAAFEAAAGEFLPPSAIEDPATTNETAVADATRVQAVALLALAAVVGLATLAFVTLAYGRQVVLARDPAATLRSLGMSGRARWVATTIPTLLAAVGAALLAVAVALAISPLFPFGLAGRAEPDPGFDVDWPVAVGGGLVVAVLLSAAGAAAARFGLRTLRRSRASARRSAVLPVVPELGVRLATQVGRGGRALPTRSVLTTAALGVALLVGTLAFGASLERLTDEPTRYGWNFDVVSGSSDTPDNFGQVAPEIEADERIGDWSVASVQDVTSRGHTFPVLGVQPIEGDALPVTIEGRAPARVDEVALGRETAAALGASVGDTIDVSPEDGEASQRFEIVGLTVLPSGDHDFPGGLGNGGVMTLAGLGRLGDTPRHVYFARAADGEDPERLLADYQARGPGFYGPDPGSEIENLDRASGVVPALAVTVAVLALVALAHGLVLTLRRRRHDFAVLSSLGLRPRQLTGMLLWQAGTVGTIALAVGIPVGIVLARLTWGLVARGLGVADDLALAGVVGWAALVVGVLAVTLALAVAPGLAAARIRSAPVLRTE